MSYRPAGMLRELLTKCQNVVDVSFNVSEIGSEAVSSISTTSAELEHDSDMQLLARGASLEKSIRKRFDSKKKVTPIGTSI